MQTSSFDFDVITGPSTPRDDRKPAQQPGSGDAPQAGVAPAQPQTR